MPGHAERRATRRSPTVHAPRPAPRRGRPRRAGPRAAGAGGRAGPRRREHLHHARPPPGPVPQVAAVRRQAARRQAAIPRSRAAHPAHRLEHAAPTTSGTSTCASPGPRASPTRRSRGCRRAPTHRGGRPSTPSCSGRRTSCTATPASPTPPGPASPRTSTSAQMIELPMLVGHYHMVAFALNSLGVQVEGPGGEGRERAQRANRAQCGTRPVGPALRASRRVRQ